MESAAGPWEVGAGSSPAMMPSPMQPPEETAPVPPSATVAVTRFVAVACMLALIVLGLAWELGLAPVRSGGSLLALKVVPLCFPIAGLLRNRMYTYRWVSLLVWLYFTEGVVRASSDRGMGRWLAGIEIVLCLLLFAACALHVRTRLRKATP